MPKDFELPGSLRALASVKAFRLGIEEDFSPHMKRLINWIRYYLGVPWLTIALLIVTALAVYFVMRYSQPLYERVVFGAPHVEPFMHDFAYGERGNKRAPLQANNRESFRDCPDCPEMLAVSTGVFRMGTSETEKDQDEQQEDDEHLVRIEKAFSASKYPVTAKEFQTFIEAEPGYAARMSGGCYVGHDQKRGERWPLDPKANYLMPFKNLEQFDPKRSVDDGMQPVVCVSWGDAMAYASWLSKRTPYKYRLLTEEEWEFLVRAGTTTRFWWGDQEPIKIDKSTDVSGSTKQRANFDNAAARTVRVDSDLFQPNPWGFVQVHGNVAEWTGDCWREGFRWKKRLIDRIMPTSNTNECPRHNRRGGSWHNVSTRLRSTFRAPSFLSPHPDGIYSVLPQWDRELRINDVGFRVARDL